MSNEIVAYAACVCGLCKQAYVCVHVSMCCLFLITEYNTDVTTLLICNCVRTGGLGSIPDKSGIFIHQLWDPHSFLTRLTSCTGAPEDLCDKFIIT
jgi:hypothetical protein